MNQHYFDVPFAFSGDVTAIPDPLQTGGTVSFTEGWNYNYQRDLATDPAALPIDRSTMNWLLLQITTAIQALQGETIPEFILSSQNGGTAFSYGPQARVLWSASGSAPFAAYVNILGAANTNTPSASDPLGATTGWQLSCDPISTSAQAAAGTNNASIMTPLLVAQQTALRALLAGSSSQVFNVATATAASHAVQFSQIAGIVGNMRNLTMTISAASASGTMTADELIVETALGGLRYCLGSFNQTINLAGTNGAGAMDIGSAPVSGFVALYAIYNPTTQTRALLATVETGVMPSIYSAGHMPSGYTASALVGVWATDSSGRFVIGTQRDRKISYALVNFLNTATVTATPSPIPCNVIPKSAVRLTGTMIISSTASTGIGMTLSATSTNVASASSSGYVLASTGDTRNFEMDVITPQLLYFSSLNNAGTPTYSASAAAYWF